MIDWRMMDETARQHVRALGKLTLVLAGGVALVFALTGCQSQTNNRDVRGVVIEKDYDPATRKARADYDITVRPDGAPTDGSQDVEIDVTRKTYNSYKIGDRYPKK